MLVCVCPRRYQPAEGRNLRRLYPFPVPGFPVIAVMLKHGYRFMAGLGLQEFFIHSFPHIGDKVMPPAVEDIGLRRFLAHAGFNQRGP